MAKLLTVLLYNIVGGVEYTNLPRQVLPSIVKYFMFFLTSWRNNSTCWFTHLETLNLVSSVPIPPFGLKNKVQMAFIVKKYYIWFLPKVWPKGYLYYPEK